MGLAATVQTFFRGSCCPAPVNRRDRTNKFFQYNAGNQLTDGRWTRTWDGENRLLTETTISAVPADAKQKLEYEYDHQGRRIRKVEGTIRNHQF